MAVVAIVVLGAWFGAGDVVASPQDAEGRLAFAAPQAGSWLVTYDVAAFGAPFPLLLSLGADGLVIETDAPGKFPLGPGFLTVLSNGHGAWEPTRGRGTRCGSLYRKLIYQEDGLTPFGRAHTGKRDREPDGASFQATIEIEIADFAGEEAFLPNDRHGNRRQDSRRLPLSAAAPERGHADPRRFAGGSNAPYGSEGWFWPMVATKLTQSPWFLNTPKVFQPPFLHLVC